MAKRWFPTLSAEWTIDNTIDFLEAEITKLKAQNKKLREKVRVYKDHEEGIYRCENCSIRGANNGNWEGEKFCDKCWNEMLKPSPFVKRVRGK